MRLTILFRNLLAATIFSSAGASFAAEVKLRVQLAWGTDGEKPAGKDLTQLDPKSREKLRHLRWKNYWVVKTEETTVSSTARRLTLSDKCAVDLKDIGNGHLEVRIFDLKPGAEPKFVKSIQHAIKALREGEYCVIAGDDRANWENAWFVIITAVK